MKQNSQTTQHQHKKLNQSAKVENAEKWTKYFQKRERSRQSKMHKKSRADDASIMIYFEPQVAGLCGQHCVNTVNNFFFFPFFA